jgi:hypothetical protein
VESPCKRGSETSGSIKMLGMYRMAAQLVASRVVLSSTDLVSYWEDFGCYVMGPTSGRHLSEANEVKPKLNQPIGYVFGRGLF